MNKLKLHFLKAGAKGKVLIKEYCSKNNENPVLVRDVQYYIQVLQVRSKDFIVSRDGKDKKIYCLLPKNSKDGSQSYWLTEDENGFVRHYKESYRDGDDTIHSLIETAYFFE